jgi:hypothetical protein
VRGKEISKSFRAVTRPSHFSFAFVQKRSDPEKTTPRLALGGQAQIESFSRYGFAVGAVDLSEIEKAGGSLRCCVGEIY